MISFPLWTNRIEYWGRFWEGEKASEETHIPQSLPLESKQPNGFGYENE